MFGQEEMHVLSREVLLFLPTLRFKEQGDIGTLITTGLGKMSKNPSGPAALRSGRSPVSLVNSVQQAHPPGPSSGLPSRFHCCPWVCVGTSCHICAAG